MNPIDKAIEILENGLPEDVRKEVCKSWPNQNLPPEVKIACCIRQGWSLDQVTNDVEVLLREALRGMQEGIQGNTPSNQIGGCDYMSLADAEKHCQQYIDMEMRDPCGLDKTAKAMLTLFRNMRGMQGQDLEALKRYPADWLPTTQKELHLERHGWNKAIDHLAARGLIRAEDQGRYNPETHILIAREDVPDGLEDAVKAFTLGEVYHDEDIYDRVCSDFLGEYSAQPHHIVKDAAALIGEKM